IRASIVFAAFVGAYFGFRYCTHAWKGRHVDAVFLMLYAIIPVFTMTQRFGLESHLMLAAGIVSVYFLARALETGSVRYYLGAGIVCGVTLYTYALAYIVLPICLVILLAYGIRLKSFNWKRAVAFIIPLGILAAPLILVQLVNFFDWPAFRIGPFTITKLITYRSNEVGAIDFIENLKKVLFNTLFYDDRSYNSTALFGNLYYSSIPFIVIGFGKAIVDACRSVKEKVFHHSVPMLAWWLGQMVIGLMLTAPSTPNNTRMIGIFGCLLYFLVAGLVFVRDLFRGKVWAKLGFAGAIGAFYLVCFVCFAKYYFTEYNAAAYPFNWLFYESYDDVGDFVEEHKGAEFLKRATAYPWNYVYYLLEFEVSPYDFNLPTNGKETYLQHDINEYLEQTDYHYNYVAYIQDTSSQDCLERMGYDKYPTGDFIYYVTPLERFVEEQHAGDLFSLDSLVYAGDFIQLSGWCVDAAAGQAFTSVILKIDEQVYRAEMQARNDVEQFFGNETCLNSGYLFMLPLD
ncbi:MAG: glycosyltransferase family 39 protein, partial [Alphaproteobacteria bacterium]|nr:glycosyltransferase family 39 protein [Alphaproteobacteria bacterium]